VPAISLVGLEEPSTAVRCSPVLYKMVTSVPGVGSKGKEARGSAEGAGSGTCSAGVDIGGESPTSKGVEIGQDGDPKSDSSKGRAAAGVDRAHCMIPGQYRIMFAVVTVSSVMVYDTQHEVCLCV
jgi:hypothetical protein